VGRIGTGFLLLVGFREGDSTAEDEWMAEKVVELRLFTDAEGKMNLALDEVSGALLVVSQFTLYGDARKGRRPSFAQAAAPDRARDLYRGFLDRLRASRPGRVEEGVFGAAMEVSLVNDGPVTLLLDREAGAPDPGLDVAGSVS